MNEGRVRIDAGAAVDLLDHLFRAVAMTAITSSQSSSDPWAQT